MTNLKQLPYKPHTHTFIHERCYTNGRPCAVCTLLLESVKRLAIANPNPNSTAGCVYRHFTCTHTLRTIDAYNILVGSKWARNMRKYVKQNTLLHTVPLC